MVLDDSMDKSALSLAGGGGDKKGKEAVIKASKQPWDYIQHDGGGGVVDCSVDSGNKVS